MSTDPLRNSPFVERDRLGNRRSKSGRLPLTGVRVIDFGQIIAIPFCTQMLAWMGAEVILVETRGRRLTRDSPPFAYGRRTPDTSGSFNLLNCNKLSVTLNLQKSEGVAIARLLVALGDVVVDNFSTGTMEKLGLGYEELSKMRPDLIMLSLGGFGRSGEMAGYAALHSGVNLVSGLATLTGYLGGRPRILGSVFPDAYSGLYGSMVILEALHARERFGEGQYIDLSMSETLTHLIPEAVFDYVVNGREPELMGNRDRVHAPQGVYRCRGWDAWVAISIRSEKEWQALCSVLNCPDLARDHELATEEGRRARHDELDTLISAWTLTQPREEAVRKLQRAGIPAGASSNAKDLLNDTHLKNRRFVRRVGHPKAGLRRMLTVPWRISDMPEIQVRHAPLEGEHTYQILNDLLGYSEDEVQKLTRGKIAY